MKYRYGSRDQSMGAVSVSWDDDLLRPRASKPMPWSSGTEDR
jgi:hypothetical protein